MFKKVLIANRGEIACRVIRTCRNLGIKTVAVYSEADKSALHAGMADESHFIGPPKVNESYLNIDAILQAAKDSGVDAIHPGYGLLSENGDFARKCEAEGITFIGPTPEVMEKMGSKIEARLEMEKAGVPVVPGVSSPIENVDEAAETAERIGYPVMLKASAGGGGIGMQRAETKEELRKIYEGNQKRAISFFGNGAMYLEKVVQNPRHIEIQVFADKHGNCVHLGERDCSVQRRNQKVVEESPSPFVSDSLRKEMGETAVKAAKALGYQNAGTIEFLVDEEKNFYFLEMNTRLQVEHPVTEEVTGTDLVEWQLAVAAGQPLPLTQQEISLSGHAIEVRIYAEDPKTFFPSPGTITVFEMPSGKAVRHECGVSEGSVVTPFYDPMLAKLIVTGTNREEAIEQLQKALENYRIEGIKTNISMLLEVVKHPSFIKGEATTAFIQDVLRAPSV
ncbi:acetyl-CoA carboxylase biotin carboxylase subunit [Bacillus sp. FJAT-44742]|uniref:acetyl-CoA carboxylase biotin carboxylase subunit n=1 Tax=Bacillus sp. FJAT-44742 TaxID=2014005 RepID=UPI000C236A94|nr:acetyl-CoA carboxylase biotin carboxylase subunit [Bacillus sp. FJAT-44742]